ncbi:LysR family transcriptional regulator [Eubacterium sp. 1001713B170207_170306_E7]|uniref:LysR family transcriptional regulator n=1 Tax=Eubacterium sp. 1001713B170207_170306_E7 TaxID=2787097 RepID=UPI00189A5072|nr:LysR family transcriptional regulator [Eubacterium sp. 1001713B170207_170306_E7]
MELRVLSYFLMVAREENITRAASLLHITQPTLSRQLMQLEDELGVKLFRRSNHNIVLTDDGMLLKRRAQEIVSLSEKTKREFLHKEEHLTGEIAIGSGELHSTQFLAELITAFHEQYPMVQFQIYSGNADNIKERIEQGILDLGLLLEPVDIRKYAFIRTPLREEWGVLMREDCALSSKAFISPRDLVHVPLIASRRELVQNELVNWFGEYADQIEIVASGNLQYNLAVLVQKKMGVAFTLRLDSHYDGLCFIPVFPKMDSGSVMAWKKTQTFSPATAAFIDFTKKYVKSIACNEKQALDIPENTL